MSEKSPLPEAQQRFQDALPFRSLPEERCVLEQANHRTVFQDITAPSDMPPYPRAIVEGFLVNTADTAAASEESPVGFSVVGEVKPGDEQCPVPQPGQAVQVSTGSIVCGGDVSIVRMWEAQRDGQNVTIARPFPPGFFIEQRGEDLKKDDVVCKAGTELGPWEVGLLAGLGISEVSVTRIPEVAIFSSGDEVIPYDQPLKPGRIRDGNAVMLAAAISDAGGRATFKGIMRDDFDAFREALSAALDAHDMVVISGGTAVGGRDFISDLMRETGELIVDGVPMRSGRPLIVGVARGKPMIGVAGHPPEALRGFRLFGTLALDRILGRERPLPADTPT